MDFTGGTVDNDPPANARDVGSVPDPEDPLCPEASQPTCPNSCACALEPRSRDY